MSTYTDQEFIEAVKSSFSIAQTLKKLGLVPAGGNYKIVHFNIKRLNIDSSHFTGKAHLKGKTHDWTKRYKNEEVFIADGKHNLSTYSLKRRILQYGFIEKKCHKCQNTTWQGEQIPLELEHINGVNNDNRLENLTLLCPNCHAQTTTYRGKNKKKQS